MNNWWKQYTVTVILTIGLALAAVGCDKSDTVLTNRTNQLDASIANQLR